MINISTDDRTCQDNFFGACADSDWSRGIDALATEFNTTQTCEESRGRFYEMFWKMNVSAAKKRMNEWLWLGDIEQDSCDVASANVVTLLRQESKGRGVFNGHCRTPKQLRGYLSRVIWRGCEQRMNKLKPRMNPMDSLDAMLEVKGGIDKNLLHNHHASDQVLRIDIKAADHAMQHDKSKRGYTLPDGMTPLGYLLDKGLLEKGGKLRTLQRNKQAIRKEFARRLGI